MLDWEELERPVPVLSKVRTGRDTASCGIRHRPPGRGGHVHRRGAGRARGPAGAPLCGPGRPAAGRDAGTHRPEPDKNVYIANMVKCRPPHNRDPLNTEQGRLHRLPAQPGGPDPPQVIICLGRISAIRLIKPDFKITKEHGQWVEKSGVHMTALFHPAAILRDPSRRPDTFVDLKGIQAKIGRYVHTPTGELGMRNWELYCS